LKNDPVLHLILLNLKESTVLKIWWKRRRNPWTKRTLSPRKVPFNRHIFRSFRFSYQPVP